MVIRDNNQSRFLSEEPSGILDSGRTSQIRPEGDFPNFSVGFHITSEMGTEQPTTFEVELDQEEGETKHFGGKKKQLIEDLPVLLHGFMLFNVFKIRFLLVQWPKHRFITEVFEYGRSPDAKTVQTILSKLLTPASLPCGLPFHRALFRKTHNPFHPSPLIGIPSLIGLQTIKYLPTEIFNFIAEDGYFGLRFENVFAHLLYQSLSLGQFSGKSGLLYDSTTLAEGFPTFLAWLTQPQKFLLPLETFLEKHIDFWILDIQQPVSYTSGPFLGRFQLNPSLKKFFETPTPEDPRERDIFLPKRKKAAFTLSKQYAAFLMNEVFCKGSIIFSPFYFGSIPLPNIETPLALFVTLAQEIDLLYQNFVEPVFQRDSQEPRSFLKKDGNPKPEEPYSPLGNMLTKDSPKKPAPKTSSSAIKVPQNQVLFYEEDRKMSTLHQFLQKKLEDRYTMYFQKVFHVLKIYGFGSDPLLKETQKKNEKKKNRGPQPAYGTLHCILRSPYYLCLSKRRLLEILNSKFNLAGGQNSDQVLSPDPELEAFLTNCQQDNPEFSFREPIVTLNDSIYRAFGSWFQKRLQQEIGGFAFPGIEIRCFPLHSHFRELLEQDENEKFLERDGESPILGPLQKLLEDHPFYYYALTGANRKTNPHFGDYRENSGSLEELFTQENNLKIAGKGVLDSLLKITPENIYSELHVVDIGDYAPAKVLTEFLHPYPGETFHPSNKAWKTEDGSVFVKLQSGLVTNQEKTVTDFLIQNGSKLNIYSRPPVRRFSGRNDCAAPVPYTVFLNKLEKCIKLFKANLPETPNFVARCVETTENRLVFKNGYWDFSLRMFVPSLEKIFSFVQLPYEFPYGDEDPFSPPMSLFAPDFRKQIFSADPHFQNWIQQFSIEEQSKLKQIRKVVEKLYLAMFKQTALGRNEAFTFVKLIATAIAGTARETLQKKFVMFESSKNSGKSTMIVVLGTLLGDYVTIRPAGGLINVAQRPSQSSSTKFQKPYAENPFVRLMFLDELPDVANLASSEPLFKNQPEGLQDLNKGGKIDWHVYDKMPNRNQGVFNVVAAAAAKQMLLKNFLDGHVINSLSPGGKLTEPFQIHKTTFRIETNWLMIICGNELIPISPPKVFRECFLFQLFHPFIPESVVEKTIGLPLSVRAELEKKHWLAKNNQIKAELAEPELRWPHFWLLFSFAPDENERKKEVRFTRMNRLLQEKNLAPTVTTTEFLKNHILFSKNFRAVIGKLELFNQVEPLAKQRNIQLTRHDLLLFIRENHTYKDSVVKTPSGLEKKFRIDGKINNGNKRVFFGVTFTAQSQNQELFLKDHTPDLFESSASGNNDEEIHLSAVSDHDELSEGKAPLSERIDPVVAELFRRVEQEEEIQKKEEIEEEEIQKKEEIEEEEIQKKEEIQEEEIQKVEKRPRGRPKGSSNKKRKPS